jgi:glycosyltransferase involved in cell wall biosynthesis
MQKKFNKNLLLVGPKLINNIKNIGGTTILMDFFEKYLKENNIEYKLIESNKYNNYVFNYLYILFSTLIHIRKYDFVIGNASLNFLKYVSPLLIVISKTFKKRYVLRKFGGSMDITYESASWLDEKLYNFTFKNSDLIFAETLLVKQFLENQFTARVEWFPNCREKQDYQKKEFQKRFISLSQVKKEKGVLEIIEVNKVSDIKIDIYGPIYDDSINLDAYYKGIVNPSEVINKLKEYDVLVLPTYWYGEGYPGIILEAFSLGMPVVSTCYRAIPEIIDDGRNGFLISPKKYSELYEAMMKFTADNYQKYSVNAYNKFNDLYDTNNVHENILEILEKL